MISTVLLPRLATAVRIALALQLRVLEVAKQLLTVNRAGPVGDGRRGRSVVALEARRPLALLIARQLVRERRQRVHRHRALRTLRRSVRLRAQSGRR